MIDLEEKERLESVGVYLQTYLQQYVTKCKFAIENLYYVNKKRFIIYINVDTCDVSAGIKEMTPVNMKISKL